MTSERKMERTLLGGRPVVGPGGSDRVIVAGYDLDTCIESSKDK